MIVILGASSVEARYWTSIYLAAIPELADAVQASAGKDPSYVEGWPARKLYIAPGAFEGSRYPEVLATLRRNLAKWHGPDPIYLGEK